MKLEEPDSIEERWIEVFRELGEPEALLACTYTFNAEFFADLLARFAEAACEGGAGKGRSFTSLTVNVVCDSTRYSGHQIGFNVSFWPISSRLFHPKLFIALFSNEVVWSDGSLNLTRAGWRRNREIAMLHRPGRRALPRNLRSLLEAFPNVIAAKRILEGTVNEKNRNLPGQFLTSLHEPIGARFLAGAPKSAEEVHLVAPFFEKNESNEESLDDKWLQQLTERYPNAHFHVYLPELVDQPLRVQGSKKLFVDAQKKLTQTVVLHPVPIERTHGPLHGKVACVVYRRNRTQQAYILVGSPNMTYAALLIRSGNIESAWILDERWKDAKKLMRAIGSKRCSIDDAEFIPPEMNRVNRWMPLLRATYDPFRYELKIEWKNKDHARLTDLYYANNQKPLIFSANNCVRHFRLSERICWLLTRKRGGGAADGCCPIDVPVEVFRACNDNAKERSPEEWLRMLGAAWTESEESGKQKSHLDNKNDKVPFVGFEWSERVRDLAARMRYIEDTLKDEKLNMDERQWLTKLFCRIYDTHNPSKINDLHEQVWRVWARLELWNTARNLSTSAPLRKDRSSWLERGKLMHRGMGIAMLPSAIQKQFRAARKALDG